MQSNLGLLCKLLSYNKHGFHMFEPVMSPITVVNPLTACRDHGQNGDRERQNTCVRKMNQKPVI